MSKAEQIVTVHERFPRLSAADIADVLGFNPDYVRAASRRKGLELPKGFVSIRSENAAQRLKQLEEAKSVFGNG